MYYLHMKLLYGGRKLGEVECQQALPSCIVFTYISIEVLYIFHGRSINGVRKDVKPVKFVETYDQVRTPRPLEDLIGGNYAELA